MSSQRSVLAGPVDVGVTGSVSVYGGYGGRLLPSDLGPVCITVDVPLIHVVQNGVFPYKMNKGNDGMFNGIDALSVGIASDHEPLKRVLTTSTSLLLGYNGLYPQHSSEPPYVLDFFKRSIPCRKHTPTWCVFVTTTNGQVVDVHERTRNMSNILVSVTDDAFDPVLDGPIPASIVPSAGWMRVLSPRFPSGEQYVIAYSPMETRFIRHPDLDPTCNITDVNAYADPGFRCIEYARMSTNTLRILGQSRGSIDAVSLHGNEQFEIIRDMSGNLMTLVPPAVPMRIIYGGREFIHKYPVFSTLEQRYSRQDSPAHRIMRILASVLMGGYPSDEGNEIGLDQVFSNAEALGNDLSYSVVSALLNSLASAESELWDAIAMSIYQRSGPHRFSYSEVPGNLDVRGAHIGFNLQLGFQITGSRKPYVLKDLAILCRLT